MPRWESGLIARDLCPSFMAPNGLSVARVYASDVVWCSVSLAGGHFLAGWEDSVHAQAWSLRMTLCILVRSFAGSRMHRHAARSLPDPGLGQPHRR